MSPAKMGRVLRLLLLLALAPTTVRASEKRFAESNTGGSQSVRLIIKPRVNDCLLGEAPVILDLTISNQTDKPIEVLKFWKLVWTLGLDMHLEGRKSGIVGRSKTWTPPKAPTGSDYNEIPAKGLLRFPVHLQHHIALYPRAADHYHLKATLKLKDGSVLSSTCSFVVKPIPKLKQLQRRRIKQATQGSHFFRGVDVGLARIAEKEQPTLFCVVRESETGKTKLRETPERTFRLMKADPKAKIQTMVYHPFPESTDTIIEVHVLVTEPNKTQHYFLVDLGLGVTLKKNQTLKPGQRYKLHQKPLGPVQLVPVDGK